MRRMRTFTLVALFALGCGGGTQTPAETPTDGANSAATEAPDMPESEGATEGAGEESSGEEGASSEGGAGGAEETRSTQTIQATITSNRKPFRACYDKARKDVPDLKGTLTIHFVLDPEGNVKKAELNVERSDIKSPAVADCAIAELKKLKFPPSSKGMDTTVNYPFDFKPDGGG